MSSDKVHSALVGAAVGAVVGAVCLATASTVAPTNLYAATAVQPAVATLPVNARLAQPRSVVGVQYAVPQSGYQAQQDVQVQGTTYTSAFVMLATVAGAVNGFFLWNNRRSAMAATTGRREALMAGAAAAGFAAGPAFAAYGEGANIFGKPKDTEQTYTVSGEGWTVEVPSKYKKSAEREFPGIVARLEDNFDAVNSTLVIVRESGKSNVTELGDIDAVRNALIVPLLGQQAYDGPSISEGGFAPGRFSSAAILDQKQVTKGGKTYYEYEILTRTADGNEGGRHQLFQVAASNGKTYILKAQAGDKRWFIGNLDKRVRETLESFRVA